MPALRRSLAGLVALGLGLGGVLVVAAPASATVIPVMDTADAGPDTLRDAIALANATPGADVITFALSGAAPWVISLATPLPLISDDITIVGPDRADLTIDGSLLGAGSGFEASTLPGWDIEIARLTISGFPDNGIVSQYSDLTIIGVDSVDNGGDGLHIVDGDLTVTDSTFLRNDFAGIYIDMAGSQTISVSGSTSDDNEIGLDGNFLAGSAVTLTDNNFSHNASGGAGFYSGNGATVDITRCIFDGNNPTASAAVGGLNLYSDGATVTIDDSDFTDNFSLGGAGMQPTLVNGGTVAVTNSRITGNTASSGGSGLGGGIYVAAVLGATAKFSLTDSVVSGNSADDAGGGIHLSQVGFNAPVEGVEITRTTIDGNSAPQGAGLAIYTWTTTGSATEPVISVKDSTISNNTGDDGAAVFSIDTGQSSASSVIAFESTTIAGNIGTAGSGGIALVGNGEPTVYVFAHSTIADNTGTGPSGISIQSPDTVRFLLSHTIVAKNTATDIEATAGSQAIIDWSLIGTTDAVTDAALAAGTGNLTGVDPKLGTLANNGGSTNTLLPAPGSPVIDAGNPAIVLYPATDQRGFARIINIIDMGALEAVPLLPDTGSTAPEPEPPLVALLLILSGLAMVAFSRLQAARSIG